MARRLPSTIVRGAPSAAASAPPLPAPAVPVPVFLAPAFLVPVFLLPAFLLLVFSGAAAPLQAQSLQGRVLDVVDGRPVPQTLVRLVDAVSGDQRSVTISDLEGRYTIQAPEPGRYVVEAERIGIADYRSREVEMPRAGAAYQLDLLVESRAIGLRGIEVTARQRRAALDRLRLLMGVSPAALRHTPIFRPVIEDHLERGHDLAQMIRWQNLPSITVRQDREGPCFKFRERGCLPVYLDGVRLRAEVASLLPLEVAGAVVVVQPNESAQFEGGGILVYTSAWLGLYR